MRTERKWQVSLVCIVLMVLLTPIARALDVCGQDKMIFGEPEPVDVACETGRLTLSNSTVNLLPGAHISEAIAGATAGILESWGGSTIDISAGIIDTYLNVVSGDVVTVHGYGFKLGEQSLEDVTRIIGPIGDFTTVPPTPELLKGTYENGDSISIPCFFEGDAELNLVWIGPSVIDVLVDIKPDSADNTVNLGSLGVIPVGILSTTDFDATTVDPWTVELAGSSVSVKLKGKGSKILSSIKDLNGDGLLDFDVKIETENLDPNQLQDGYAILTGRTYPADENDPNDLGQEIQGTDVITIVPVE